MRLNGRRLQRCFVLTCFASAVLLLPKPRTSSLASGSSLRRFYSTLELPVYASESPQTKSSGAKKSTAPVLIPLPDGKGKDTTKRVCSGCHSTITFASQAYAREKWSSVIDTMTAKGMDASEDEIAEILDYLTASFPLPPDKSAPTAPANPPPSK